MSDLHRALYDIRSIRRQVADATEFHGYGPATMALTAAIAAAAALLQPVVLRTAAYPEHACLLLWIATAAVAVGVAAIGVLTRSRRMHSSLSDEMIRMAVQQFLPSVVAGLLVTIVLAVSAHGVLWLLPGLWQVIFSLGIFASCRFLPRTMLAPACWYLGTGLACLTLGKERALEPWTMGVPFAVGQLLIAAVLQLRAGEEDTNA